ncbi:Glycine--tRNA ligase beta subunit [Aquicella siphonis]|uniref:Glycine--tRNA ligase beta subunit n=1 Tax=Aquicella siphonis TaxID=254247 RepID=A0A5E4PIF2_9COXI|nr:glycine--tRNA ligase subunit beta [Aquicella siphonis]VVC76829.1 Glycine--tRNA ligase beta subunit [Aquicella siphonis]
MKKHEDFLIEIHTEELPSKSILKLGEGFCQQISERLHKAGLEFDDIKFFATPRRLAVFVKDLAATQPDQVVERRGPAVSAAFTADGKPTPACAGFARSCGVAPEELTKTVTPQGEWVSYTKKMPGKSVAELMPEIAEQAALTLPIPRRMRWGEKDAQFARPIHSVMMLYGDKVIEGTILGYPAGRMTRGHRFHAPDWFTLLHAAEYEALMRDEAYVIADFESRRSEILNAARASVELAFTFHASALIDHDLLDEVTGLVEFPVALIGSFDKEFLALPPEVLISSMQDHQRYFPVAGSDEKLLPHFVAISNIKSHDPKRVIHGNERVLRARLADAAFFYSTDKKESLESRIERLKGIVFQAKLGTLYDKAERISRLAAFIAEKMHADAAMAARAGLLAKTDLTTSMVGEFPELQGVMGYYYARHDGLPDAVAEAMKEQYMPRFSGDDLPGTPGGQALALADRLDSLAGAFGINQIPTGDKDPFGLRRAALGVIRILVEKNIRLDLREALEVATAGFAMPLPNKDTVTQVLGFIQERMRSWYQEQGIMADVFASVAALGIADPLDIHERIKAVQAFKKLSEAETLSIANKRVSNILSKYVDMIDAQAIDPQYFENSAEQELARQLEAKSKVVAQLSQSGKYDEVLLQLAELRKPVDDFFDQVMVMTEDKPRRENRILLLSKLRALFLQVADIALLQ